MPEDTEADVPAQLDTLAADVKELREGLHELLRMWEETGRRHRTGCWYADMQTQARTDVLALDVFANSTLEGEPEMWQP